MSFYPRIVLRADEAGREWIKGLFYHVGFTYAEREASLLIQKGYRIISPALMIQPMQRGFTAATIFDCGEQKEVPNFRRDFENPPETWMQYRYALAEHCRGGILLGDGWDQVPACLQEIGWFEAWNRPIFVLEIFDGKTAICGYCRNVFYRKEVKDTHLNEVYRGGGPCREWREMCQTCHKDFISSIQDKDNRKQAIQYYEKEWGEPFKESAK